MCVYKALNSALENNTWKEEFEKIVKSGEIEFFQDKSCGITIAKCDHEGGKFVRVAVAYCGENDKWKKKYGKYIAAYKLGLGQCILIPKIDGWGTNGWDRVEFIRENI